MDIAQLKSRLRGIWGTLRSKSMTLWGVYRARPFWQQVVLGIVAVLLLFFIFSLLRGGSAGSTTTSGVPTVSLATVGSLSGTGGMVSVIGTVRSITEADILAQSGGTVTALHASLGTVVGTGYVIAELENASQRAAVLQAEGSYEAAIAARSGTSVSTVADSARNTYATAFSTLDSLLKSDIDTLFGDPGGLGPQILISHGPYDYGYFPIKRKALDDAMTTWRSHLSSAASTDPEVLLQEADTIVRQAIALGNDLSVSATKVGNDATDDQEAALEAARAGFTTVQASITAAKSSYQSQSTSATAGADASVKIALGSLRAAQAQLEKTLIRAPIGGTINFLPIRRGDYVTALTHVATVAQNGALEITSNISEESRQALLVGGKVTIEDAYPGVITSIAPALDPVTKQIEIRVALTGTSPLVNGQSVRIALPSDAPVSAVSGPLLLPLTALKLTPSARVVFSVGPDERLIAHTVTIGDVHGDRIEITSELPQDLRIATDARGLSEGQKVAIAAAP
jgi:RND family efflux transporter MFP subunit